MPKEKVNYQEVYDLYQLCSETKDLKDFCSEYGVNYDSHLNFIKDGRVQILNNLCEQRIKPVKLNLKNCQNIGSENAAENTVFVFSLTESCRLNGINPETYLE